MREKNWKRFIIIHRNVMLIEDGMSLAYHKRKSYEWLLIIPDGGG